MVTTPAGGDDPVPCTYIWKGTLESTINTRLLWQKELQERGTSHKASKERLSRDQRGGGTRGKTFHETKCTQLLYTYPQVPSIHTFAIIHFRATARAAFPLHREKCLEKERKEGELHALLYLVCLCRGCTTGPALLLSSVSQ